MICPNCDKRAQRSAFYTGNKDPAGDEVYKCSRCGHSFTENDQIECSRVKKPEASQ
ncbi:MAG: hypothetical protein ABSA11_05620 [Candidatus Bathyarchaeia archaeon]|jgi:transposase-like protein